MRTMNRSWFHNIGPRIAVLVACLCASGSAAAQEAAPPPQQLPTGEPVSLTIAMSGVVVSAAGFGMMLHETGPCYCGPSTGWILGGIAVVAAGVTMTWLGLRSRTITVAPTLGPHVLGGTATVRLGQARHDRRNQRNRRVP